jgi:hypothetical protein
MHPFDNSSVGRRQATRKYRTTALNAYGGAVIEAPRGYFTPAEKSFLTDADVKEADNFL